MKILLTGITGYIGKRILPILVEQGHDIVCCTRDISRIPMTYANSDSVTFIEVDFLDAKSLSIIPEDIDAAYYLIHSMSSDGNFSELEFTCAYNFKKRLEKTSVKQVIYLSGIVNDSALSKHLLSRKKVENTLRSRTYALTVLKAGIIVGSGSASFEIIRDLVEKLPFMVAPKWLNTKTQPIAIRDVLTYLTKVLGREDFYNKSYDIFGPNVLTYKQMLLMFAEVRGLKRVIWTVPVMTPRLSSYWLYFVTSTSFKLAKSLVDSMKVEIIGKESNINKLLNVTPLDYKTAVAKAFVMIEQNHIISSWKDSKISGRLTTKLSKHIQVPEHGCLTDERSKAIKNTQNTINRLWSIGGDNGWYSGDILWKIRGFIDKIFGGIGLRRGRRHPTELQAGEALDFWRVLVADKKEKRLLLYAEMKLPGEAWLEFNIKNDILYQRAVFRPKGINGRIYWFLVFPFHELVFRGLINKLVG